MSILNNSLLLGAAAGASGYQISRSLRFNSADSAFLSRTPASAGNRKTWTWSGWVKRSALGTAQNVFGNFSSIGIQGAGLRFDATDQLSFFDFSSASPPNWQLLTSAVFRDVSAWFHLVAVLDTTNATADNRVRLYINGIEQTVFSTRINPSLNYDGFINNTNLFGIGRGGSYAADYFSGYLADIHFIDGQALTPSSFAETNATTGQWVPKAYTGSYGTNGFRLDFSDNSAATATTLGKDRAGSNNWTPNNLSVTAGTGNDSLVDTPTSYGTDTGAGGEVGGNYATLNPLALGGGTLSNGNLDVAPAGFHATRNSTIKLANGKWYAEFNLTAANPCGLGITSRDTAYTTWPDNSAGNYWFYFDGGAMYFYPGGDTQSAVGGSPATGVWKIALDLDSRKCWIGVGSIWYDSAWGQTGNPATGANPTFSSLPTGDYYMFVETHTSASWSANFGQRPFAYTAPSGFKALCDTNLPAPVVAKPSTVMDVKLYTGNGGTQTISGLGFSPDLVWIKKRNSGSNSNHLLADTVRGVSTFLSSSGPFAESTFDAAWRSNWGDLTAFNSDGFTVVAGSSSDDNINDSPNTHVAWTWDAGSSTVTNTQGSITSQVRANASAGFSIVTYTGNGSAGATVGHGLGVAPSLVVIKSRSATTDWPVWHRDLTPGSGTLWLNYTVSQSTYINRFDSTGITSSVVKFGSTIGELNTNNSTYVAYCFAPVAGYSSFGSYTGNGSADGPFVFTGFRPRWILIKNASSAVDWELVDTARDTSNGPQNNRLQPNSSAAEAAGYTLFDTLSNGFKVRSSTSNWNGNTNTIIYAAFAENPFQYARAR